MNPERPAEHEPQMVPPIEDLKRERKRLTSLLGTEPKEPEEPLNVDEVKKQYQEIQADYKYESLEEQAMGNRLRSTLDTIGLRSHKEAPTAELAVQQQRMTYFEYLPDVVRQVQDVLMKYEVLRTRVPSVSPALLEMERQSTTYLQALNAAIAERIAFANVRFLDLKFRTHDNGRKSPEDLLALHVTFKPQLSEASRIALGKPEEEQRKRSNQLDQRVFDILSGNANIEGIQPNFLPQKMYTALISERIKQLSDQERAKARKGEWQENSMEAQERKELTDEMVRITNDLGQYQLHTAELSTIQHQFGDAFDATQPLGISNERTSDPLRLAIEKSMELRSEFHLNQMNQFMDSVQNEVLHVGLPERIEDFSNETGRSLVLTLSQRVANLFSAVVPETAGLRGSFRNWLVGPLEEAMGWPEGVKWDDLTPEQKENIKKKTQSVMDAIKSFDRQKIVAFQRTVNTIRMMPPASAFAGQEVKEPLPNEIINAETSAELQTHIDRLGGPTVYAMLFRQLNDQWGDPEKGTGFIGEYGKFYGKITEVVDIHQDVSSAMFQLHNNYLDMAKDLWWAAGLGLVAGATLPTAWMVFSKVRRVRKTAQLNRRVRDAESAARLAQKEAKSAKEEARMLREQLRKTTSQRSPTETRGPAGETGGSAAAAESIDATADVVKASRVQRILKFLGKWGRRGGKALGIAGTVLSATELTKDSLYAMSMKDLEQMEAALAARELMEGHPDIDRSEGSPVHREIQSIEDRIDWLNMRFKANEIVHDVQGPAKRTPEATKKAQEITQLAQAIAERANDRYNDARASFPIEDVMGKSKFAGDAIFVNFDQLDAARKQGSEYLRQKEHDDALLGRKPDLTDISIPGLDTEQEIDPTVPLEQVLRRTDTARGLRAAFQRLLLEKEAYDALMNP